MNQNPAHYPQPPSRARSRPKFTEDAAWNIFEGFAVGCDETRDFLASLISSGTATSEEVDRVYDVSLTSGAVDWGLMINCAVSMQGRRLSGRSDLESNSTLFACFDELLVGDDDNDYQSVSGVEEPGVDEPGVKEHPKTEVGGTHPSKRKERNKKESNRSALVKSDYWADEPSELPDQNAETHLSSRKRRRTEPPFQEKDTVAQITHHPRESPKIEKSTEVTTTYSPSPNRALATTITRSPQTLPKPKKSQSLARSRFFSSPRPTRDQTALLALGNSSREDDSSSSSSSPSSPCAKKASRRRARAPAGTLSSLPFPPLSAPRFGLIQEELAHDPFQLLVAVRLLIKTAGKAAIPTFKKLMARFPTPEALVAAEKGEVVDIIRHLGLGHVRGEAIQRYARLWVERPPCREVRYGVKNYPRLGDAQEVRVGERFGPEEAGHNDYKRRRMDEAWREEGGHVDDDGVGAVEAAAGARRGIDSAWEIGHITQGPYAIDSWRIFCRDVLLGRAKSWTGKGRRSEFQPEWMRVLPADKELRACLRWMWMKEGWDWDPVTGEREILSEELRLAVDEGRVGYDETGRLQIVEAQPRDAIS